MDQALKAEIAETLEVDQALLTSELRLDTIENWDSVNRLTIMVILGDATGAPVFPSEMAKLTTFGDIEEMVAGKKI